MTYPSTRLDVSNLILERGEFVLSPALTFTAQGPSLIQLGGENGAGKTTALRALAGLVTPASGSIHWCRQSIDKLDNYATSLNYIGHVSGLSAELSVRENLEFIAAIGRQQQVRSPAAALALLEAQTFAEQPVRQLSAGQRQRAALARLALFDCPLWMLDEPFTALDADSRKLVENLIDDHLERGGIALIATHQPWGGRHQATQIHLGRQST